MAQTWTRPIACSRNSIDAREAVAAELDTTVRERALALIAGRAEFELANDSKGRLLPDCEEPKEGEQLSAEMHDFVYSLN